MRERWHWSWWLVISPVALLLGLIGAVVFVQVGS